MAQPRRQPTGTDAAPAPARVRASGTPKPATKPTSRPAPKPTSRPAAKRQIDLGVRTYKGAIYDALSSMIAELELPPGARLVEADLVRRFNVSKTPIREAFLLLEGDGLVELVPYVGARVTWMSLDAWEESQFIFDALEQSALPRISERITPRDVKALHRLTSRLRKLRAERNSAAYARTMWEIHQRLFAPSGYPRLVGLLLNEGRRIGRRYQRAFIHEFDDHWDLEMEVVLGRVDAIGRGDPAGAAALVAEGHARLLALLRARAQDPRIAPYLAR